MIFASWTISSKEWGCWDPLATQGGAHGTKSEVKGVTVLQTSTVI